MLIKRDEAESQRGADLSLTVKGKMKFMVEKQSWSA